MLFFLDVLRYTKSNILILVSLPPGLFMTKVIFKTFFELHRQTV